MNNELRTKKAFTLMELMVAVAILAMVISFTSVIFKVSIGAHRTAKANAEIMQKLRAITDQLNADFKGLPEDGYLILRCELISRKEYAGDPNSKNFRSDRLYYFCEGDFQSWFDSNRSNIARIYFGHDSNSISDNSRPANKWSLARDVVLLTPGYGPKGDYVNLSYADFKADIANTLIDANSLLINRVPINSQADPNDIRRLMCQNTGEIKIEWTDGVDPNSHLINWQPSPSPTAGNFVPFLWVPSMPKPKALRFTFTLYDSRRILKEGQTFTHIVCLD